MTNAARGFPSGLLQPPGAFRFSADALYLAFFAATAFSAQPRSTLPHAPVLLDLGTGCGVAALAALRLLDRAHGPLWRAVGVDCQPCLVEAARANAALLGLADRFVVVDGDVADSALLESLPRAHLILANPPWRLEGQGLLPPSPVRRRALFGTPETLPLFARAAAQCLAPDGILCSVVGTERIDDQLSALHWAGLRPTLMAPLRVRPEGPPPFALVEARNAAH